MAYDSILRDTMLIPGPPGRKVLPIPFSNLHAPMGDILREGWDGAARKLERMLVERTLAIRNGCGWKTNPQRTNFSVRTPLGRLRITLGVQHDASARLELDDRVYQLGAEIVVKNLNLPQSVIVGLIDRPLDEVVALPGAHPHRTARILRMRNLVTSLRIVIDVPKDEVRLDEIRPTPGTLARLASEEMLAMCA